MAADPLIGQINEFQRRTTDALEAIVDEQREKDEDSEGVSGED